MTETETPDLLRPRTVQRRLARWSDLQPYIGFRHRTGPRRRRHLDRAQTIGDLRDIARSRLPRAVFDFVDGGAEQEISMRRARSAFDRVEFSPRVLRDVSSVDTSVTILGESSALPVVFAPTGLTRMLHHEGEIAVARAAARSGIPYTLSAMGTTSPEEVHRCAPLARQWFQTYLWKDREATSALIESAMKANFEALVLTVDTPVGGARLRDVRNGLTLPPSLSPRTFAGMASRPRWWMNILTTDPLEFASISGFNGTVAELIGQIFDPSAGPADLVWLRSQWSRKLVVKGIQSTEDARMMVDLGADAVVVSNHGGRQLDRAPTPLELLPDVVAAVEGRCEVLVDTGVRNGADLIAARGLGASAAMVGRAYLYGLMAGGEDGVDRAISILTTETVRTMQLLGRNTLADLEPGTVRLRTAD